MIKLTRVRTEAVVAERLRGDKRVELELELLANERAGEHDFKSSRWKTAKDQLKAETHGKCAYCEASTNTVAHGDVEHYRPKKVYWWLAYCYDNYLFSCQICNQSFKSANFPVFGSALPAPVVPANGPLEPLAGTLAPDPLPDGSQPLADFHALSAGEEPGIPDPYQTDPEPLFRWRSDDVLKEVEIEPRDDTQAAQRAFEAVRDFLGLNREELKRARFAIYEMAEAFRQLLDTAALPAAQQAICEDQLRNLMDASGQFAGMIRYFVEDEWQLGL